MLDGQVGRQSPGGELDHQLFGNTGEAHAHERPGVLALLLGGLSERSEQWIGRHLLLVPPEAQSDLAARAHDAARFTQGGETVPPNAPKARGHVEAIIVKR